ncbi:hypothetical protein LTR85_004648 [Meristemomyces frigidus]|nr:hypothetical protein LTR85_004648 [Meristemomyces frigidus]
MDRYGAAIDGDLDVNHDRYDQSRNQDDNNTQEAANARSSLEPSQSADVEKHPRKHHDEPIPIYKTLSPLHEFVFVCLLCCTQLLTQAALGQILAPVHIIGDSLGTTNPGKLSWMIAGYSLTVGTFVLPAGRLGDIYGSKIMVIVGWAWLGFFSIIAGFSVYAPKGEGAVVMFCLFNGIRGIGPAILLPNALAICGRVYPNGPRKDLVFSLFAMTAPSGAFVGGIFGGIFSQWAWWPWTLWSTGIAGFCLSFACWLVIPGEKWEEIPKGQKFDHIGSLLGVSGLILFNFAWNQASVVTWDNGYVCALLAVGVLLLVAFTFYEKHVEQPILPPEIFNIGSVSMLSVVGLGWASFGVFIYYIFQIMEIIRGRTPVQSCVQLIALAVAGCVAALSTSKLIRVVPAPWLMAVAALAFMVGNILIATMGAHQIYWAETFVALIIMPFGMDISFPASALILSDMVPPHLQGTAASLVNTVINYSISLGLGIAGTAEMEVDPNGLHELHGYRIALWVAVGMAGLALAIALAFATYAQHIGLTITEGTEEAREEAEKEEEEEEQDMR